MFTLPIFVGIVFQKDDAVLLVRRHNTDWMPGYWNFPGGLLEENESLINAAVREAKEELGVTIVPENLEFIYLLQVHRSSINANDIIGIAFKAQSWEGTPVNNEPHRHSEIGWFNFDNLPKNITERSLHVIEGLKTGRLFSEN